MARRTPTPRRRYTDADRAAALAGLAANGGNLKRTARELGLSETTLRHWRDGTRHPEAAQLGAQKTAALADQFEALAHKLLGIADVKAASLNAKDAVTAAAIAVDKMRLLRTEPTAISRDQTDDEYRHLTDDELERELADARRQVEAARGRPRPAGDGAGGGGPGEARAGRGGAEPAAGRVGAGAA